MVCLERELLMLPATSTTPAPHEASSRPPRGSEDCTTQLLTMHEQWQQSNANARF